MKITLYLYKVIFPKSYKKFWLSNYNTEYTPQGTIIRGEKDLDEWRMSWIDIKQHDWYQEN